MGIGIAHLKPSNPQIWKNGRLTPAVLANIPRAALLYDTKKLAFAHP